MDREKLKLCRASSIVFSIGLFVVGALICYIAFLFENAAALPQGLLYITLRCRIMVEYAVLSLVILVGGALLIDCVFKGKL